MSFNKGIQKLQATIEDLKQQLDAKQAIIDSLMLEYCPQDMSKEQLETWAQHQQVTDIEQAQVI